jgi:hypothetical protein
MSPRSVKIKPHPKYKVKPAYMKNVPEPKFKDWVYSWPIWGAIKVICM